MCIRDRFKSVQSIPRSLSTWSSSTAEPNKKRESIPSIESNSAVDSKTSCVPRVIAVGIELGAVITILKSNVSDSL